MIAPSAAVFADSVMSSACRADDLNEIPFFRKKIDSESCPSDSDIDKVSFLYQPQDIFDNVDFRASDIFAIEV